jgi:hypothetical protein
MRGSSINQERRTGPLLGRPRSNSCLAAPRRYSANTFYAQALQSTRRINAHSSAAPPPQSGFVQPVSLRDPPSTFAHACLRCCGTAQRNLCLVRNSYPDFIQLQQVKNP